MAINQNELEQLRLDIEEYCHNKLINKLLNLIDNYEIVMGERDKALFSLREMSYQFDRTRMKLKDLEDK